MYDALARLVKEGPGEIDTRDHLWEILVNKWGRIDVS